MYMSILSGLVSPQNASIIEASYNRVIKNAPEGLIHSYLVQHSKDKKLWQIVTVWKDEEYYETCVRGKISDICVQMFCDAGSVPRRETFDVKTSFFKV